MKRYLLFDSGCCQCSKIAKAIEQEAGGKLTIRSLRDPAVKELLDRERPGWKWEPMLVEEKDDQVRVYADGAMSRRLLVVLGPRRAWKILGFVTNLENPTESPSADQGRRGFLRLAGAAAIGAVALMLPGVSSAEGGPIPSIPKPQSFLRYRLPTPEEQRRFREKAHDSKKFTNFVENEVSKLDQLTPGGETPRVFIVNGRIIVQYAIVGGAGYSGYEVHFDENSGRLIETRSALLVYDEDRNVVAKFFINDNLRLDAVFTDEGKLLRGQAFDDNGKEIDIATLQGVTAQAVTMDWGCVNSCLSSLGLPSWLLGVLAVICAAVCIASAGWGCYLCIAGAGYGFYLEAYYCVDQCCNHCLS